ncbi:MAG: YdcF family protein [Gemmatimonadales bacterium]
MPDHKSRRWLVALGLSTVLLLFSWVGLVVAILFAAGRDNSGPADAIVVLGAAQYNGRPSPAFRARLDHAAALYGRGFAPVVVVTGGVGEGDSLSEAQVGVAYLRAQGLPPSSLAAVPEGQTTYATLRAVAAWMPGHSKRSALLVSDDFHLFRLQLIARQLGLPARTSAAPRSPLRRSSRSYFTLVLAESFKVPVAFLLRR